MISNHKYIYGLVHGNSPSKNVSLRNKLRCIWDSWEQKCSSRSLPHSRLPSQAGRYDMHQFSTGSSLHFSNNWRNPDVLLTSWWSNLVYSLPSLTSGLLAGFWAISRFLPVSLPPTLCAHCTSLTVSHEFAFSFNLSHLIEIAGDLMCTFQLSQVSALGTIFFLIFISIGHFNGDLEGEELDTCADITFLPRRPWLLF